MPLNAFSSAKGSASAGVEPPVLGGGGRTGSGIAGPLLGGGGRFGGGGLFGGAALLLGGRAGVGESESLGRGAGTGGVSIPSLKKKFFQILSTQQEKQ